MMRTFELDESYFGAKRVRGKRGDESGKDKKRFNDISRVFSTCASMQDARRDGIDEGIEEGLKRVREEGLQRGREEGLQRGLQRGIRTTAKNLLALGLPIEKIAQATGLSIEEIEKL